MASAYRDKIKGGWIADICGVHCPRSKRKRIRIPAERCATEEAAQAYAEECERYARILEGVPTAADIEHALVLKVIAAESAGAMRQARVLPPTSRSAEGAAGPWTVLAAAETHPATRREKTAHPADYRKHVAQLEAYCTWSGSQLLADVSLERVMAWCDVLRQRGLAWDTRRHHLLYLRRATQMAATVARLPDVIGRIGIDRHDQRREIEIWTLRQMLSACVRLAQHRLLLPRRAPGVIALGGCLGLRPSEICRLQVADLDGDVLRVGVRERKNSASRRDLPVPAAILPWLQDLRRDPETGATRPGSSPLVKSVRKGHLQAHALDDWWRTHVRPEIGGGDALGPKHLRKSFASWCVESGIETRHFEAYLGHRLSEISLVTQHHYLAASRVPQLRPAAERMSARIEQVLEDIRGEAQSA